MDEHDITTDKFLADLPVVEGQVKIGDCLLSKKIGQGGMGAVYLGKQVKLKVPVAVKVLPFHLADANPKLIARFKREAQTAARLDHPNLIRVYAVDEDEGVSYLIMEFIDGEDVQDRLEREGPFPEAEALDIAIAAGEALAEAHSQGIMHRDMKPANIMIRHRDGRVKVTDLGLAKSFLSGDRESAAGLTATGQILGTPAFMSPEQAAGKTDIDHRADIYSLGATLYTMLTNEHVHETATLIKLLQMVATERAPAVREVREDVSDVTAEVVAKMLEKDRDERFRTMEETVASLKGARKMLESVEAASLARPQLAGKNPVLAGFTLETAAPEVPASAARRRGRRTTEAQRHGEETPEETVVEAEKKKESRAWGREAEVPSEARVRVPGTASRMWIPVTLLVLVGAGFLIAGLAGVQPIAGWLGRADVPSSSGAGVSPASDKERAAGLDRQKEQAGGVGHEEQAEALWSQAEAAVKAGEGVRGAVPGAASLLPEHVLLAWTCDDIGEMWEAVRNTDVARMLEDEEMKPFVSGIKEAVKKQLDEAEAVSVHLERMKKLVDLSTGELAYALIDMRLKGSEAEMDAVAFVGVKSEQEVRALLDDMIPRERTETYRESGVEIRSYVPEPGLVLCWTVTNGHIVASAGRENMRKALQRLDGAGGGSLADNERFKKAAAGVKSGGQLYYVDVAGLLEMLRRQMRVSYVPADEIRKAEAVIEALGLSGISSVAYSIRCSGGAVEESAFVDWRAPRKGIAALVVPGDLAGAVGKLVPEQACYVFAKRIGFSEILPLVRNVVRAADEKQVAELDGGLEMVRSTVGIDIENDVFNALGREVLFLGGPYTGGSPLAVLTANAIALPIKDHDAAAKVYGAGMTLLAAQLSRQGEQAPSITPFEYEGYQCHGVNIPMPMLGAMSPSACLTEDFLIVAADSKMLKQILKVHAGKKPSLLKNPKFAEAVPGAAKADTVGLQYVDWAQVASGVLPLVRMGASFIPVQQQKQFGLDMTLFPSDEAITKYLFPQGGRSWARSDGFHYEGKSPFGGLIPGGPVGASVVAAIAIPNLVQSRTRTPSTKSGAIAHLKTYASAQNIYHRTDYDGDGALEYAQDLSDLHDVTVTVGGVARRIELVDLAFSLADSDAGDGSDATPKAGYYFVDCTGTTNEGPFISAGDDEVPEGYLDEYALCAVPAQYKRTGINTYVIGIEGMVYKKDTGGKPVTLYPNAEIEKGEWIPVGW